MTAVDLPDLKPGEEYVVELGMLVDRIEEGHLIGPLEMELRGRLLTQYGHRMADDADTHIVTAYGLKARPLFDSIAEVSPVLNEYAADCGEVIDHMLGSVRSLLLVAICVARKEPPEVPS